MSLTVHNLLRNPGFETGDLTGWTVANAGDWVIDANDSGGINPYMGSCKLHCTTGYVSSPLISESIPVTGPMHFAFMLANGAGDRTCWIGVEYDDADPVMISSVGSYAWKRFDYSLTPPSGAQNMRIRFSYGQYHRFDNLLLCTQADWQLMQQYGINYVGPEGITLN